MMSFYEMMFGKNPQADLLLAVIGLKQNDVERFRDVFASDDGKTIEVYTRTGGGNRDDYPQELMRHTAGWVKSVDDDFDSTYCTDTFNVPAEFVKDVANLSDILSNGLRKKFGKHLQKTLQRNPTESDIEVNKYDNEKGELDRTQHFMANGHTFVPQTDHAMKTALSLAEKNGGKLRSCWGILPLIITVQQNAKPLFGAKGNLINRIYIGYDWIIDEPYWEHCKEVFATEFPISIAIIDKKVKEHLSCAKIRA